MSENKSEILTKFAHYQYLVAYVLIIFGSILLIFYLWQLWKFFADKNTTVVFDEQINSGSTKINLPLSESDREQDGVQNKIIASVVVDIAGAVKKPGIYRLKPNARLNDLLILAGGFLSADVDRVYLSQELNLAVKLVDGEKYYIPYWHDRSEITEVRPIVATNKSQQLSKITDKSSDVRLISLNQASASELEQLPGIGKVRAQAIIANRPYQELLDLVNKKVVSEKLFNQIKNKLKL